ncbi:polysaccharide deacetylase family protein [Actinoplanes sp. NPDC026670]|uniref:polysaccharide deacetylase family protein n=1 Tax=Actinoplanes sp. NPDC026670 TaxID=3154700 RepID=UPI0033F1AAD6
MNTDKPTPATQDSMPAVDETAEPTAVLSEPGEPTVALPAAEPTVDLPADTEAADETVELSVPEEDGEETVALSAPEDGGEETVALSVPEDGEETVALSEDGGEETVALLDDGGEETVALSAGELAAASEAAESEPTAVISAPAEPTIALPKPRISPEAKVALPLKRTPDAEPTVALSIPPSPRPAPEPTVALPSVPAQRPAPTVTPPPSEPTVALPVAPVAPVAVPQRFGRRRLLWGLSAVAGTALAGGTIAALAGRGEPEAAKAPNLQVSEPPPAQHPSPRPSSPQPTTPVVKVPVHTLADFRKLVPGDPFPADSIALTIDDGPHPVWTPPILRLLEKYHVPALFCMIGNQVLGHENTAKDVAADGHQIANHTWSHPIDLAQLPPHKMIKEIHRAQDKIYSTTGATPSLFRAPGGAWSDGLAGAVSKSNVIAMDWTNDPRDWAQPGVAHITNRMLAARPGQILLCHDGGGDRSQTLASLKTVIPALQAQGLKFVALT